MSSTPHHTPAQAKVAGRASSRPDRTLLLLLLSAATIALAACGGPDGDAGETVGGTDAEPAIDTVGGVERLRYPASAGARLGWALDTVLVLGDAFADDAYQFNEVSPEGLAARDDGGLLVLDRQGKRILEYGPDGAHRQTFGREGAGPGELSQPLGMATGPGDTVWVTDFDNSRITGFPPTGGDPRLVPFPENSGFPAGTMAAVDEAFLLQFTPLFTFGRGAGGGFQMSRGDGEEEAEREMPVVRFGAESLTARDTLWTAPEPPRDMVQLEAGDRLMVTLMSREFWPELQWEAFSDGGVVVSDTAAYVLRLIDADGTVRRIIERAPAPRATTEADREAAKQRVRDEAQAGGGVRMGGAGPSEEQQKQMLEQRLEKMTFAETVPRVIALAVDLEDRIWVGVTEEEADVLARIDIYDRDGRLVGELRDVPMPDVFLAGDRIGMLRRDDLDVQQVVVATIGATAD